MIYPSKSSEYVLSFFFSFAMTIISGQFFGVLAAVQSNSDPLTQEFKARVDRLNSFLADQGAPEELKERTRAYLRFTRASMGAQTYDSLYELFSPALKGDMLYHVSLRTLKLVPYFRGCDAGFMRELSHTVCLHPYHRTTPVCCPRRPQIPLIRHHSQYVPTHL